MATDTAPTAVPGPPDPPGNTATTGQDPKSFLASVVAPVDPARPTFNLNPTTGDNSHPATDNGALDRSAPGVTSDTFRDTTEKANKNNDAAGTRHKRSIWKEMWLAAATRWAKGGGTANKRLDLKKAKAQAHQVKEARTTSAVKSGGLPVRNSGGSGAGVNKGSGKPTSNSGGKEPANSAGNRSNSGGRSGSGGPGGGRGAGGGAGSSGSGTGRRDGKDTGLAGKGGSGTHRRAKDTGAGTGTGKGAGSAGGDKHASKKTDAHGPAGSAGGKQPTAGTGGGSGKSGSSGKNGKDGSSGKSGSGTDTKVPNGKTDLTKTPKNSNSKNDGDNPGSTKTSAKQQPAHEKTPLQKSRETGHGDGTKTRRAVDHVKAYTDGVRDGWDDEKTRNAKEHDRLNKAHTTHQPKADQPDGPIVTEKGDDGVTTDVKPLTVKTIDANTLTLGTDNARSSVGRRELRNFKQYERKLEAKSDTLQKIAEACVQLAGEAEDEAKDCQQLAEQAKSVEGGEKLGATLSKLAEAAQTQAVEAAELAQRARKAADMCKAVLANIQTRYAPLYKAVVDSDETKPAELRFYNDKGTYAPAA